MKKKKAHQKPAKAADKRRIFVREYLVDRNGTRAAIAAGYSKKTAEAAASRLLRNVKVAEEIGQLTEKRIEGLEVTSERVLRELARLAFLDPRKFFKDDGSLKDVHELDDDTAAALAGMEVDDLFEGSGEDRKRTGYTRKIKFNLKLGALQALGKHLKLFTDSLEVHGPHGNQIDLNLNITFKDAEQKG